MTVLPTLAESIATRLAAGETHAEIRRSLKALGYRKLLIDEAFWITRGAQPPQVTDEQRAWANREAAQREAEEWRGPRYADRQKRRQAVGLGRVTASILVAQATDNPRGA